MKSFSRTLKFTKETSRNPAYPALSEYREGVCVCACVRACVRACVVVVQEN